MGDRAETTGIPIGLRTEHDRLRSTLSLVIPVFNESANLHELITRVQKALDPIGLDYRLIFVDDGSTDNTVSIITAAHHEDQRIALISLSRNFGHQAAIQAGLERAPGEAIVIMDGDLQDPPEVVPRMIELWCQGADVVFAVRRKRKESPFKLAAYALYYRLLRLVSEVTIPLDSGDFCLVSRKVVDVIRQCRERNRFIRGIRSWAGFTQIGFEYERDARFSGEAKYSWSRLWKLALDGLFSFSSLPLRLATYVGLTFFLMSSMYILYALWSRIIGPATPPGWASLIVAVLFMGSVQLIILGIIGEYLARIYEEAKQRPLFVVRKTLGIE